MTFNDMVRRLGVATSIQIRLKNNNVCIINSGDDYEQVLTSNILNGEVDDWFVLSGRNETICINLKGEKDGTII